MVTTTTTTESRTDALRRLLQIARESGVRLGVDRDGDFYATSVSEPGRLYPLTPQSCGCRGFATHRRCRHVAALWSHLGYFDGPDNGGAALPDCATCFDSGMIDAPHARWVGPSQTGYRDMWNTVVSCPACQPVAA